MKAHTHFITIVHANYELGGPRKDLNQQVLIVRAGKTVVSLRNDFHAGRK